jgi:Flp pilus assembly protein TadG
MKLMHRGNSTQRRSGQLGVLFAVMIPILFLTVGLVIDVGRAYVTKTALGKALDAAALAAMKNLNLGQSQATTIAHSTFNVNFGSNPPVPTITYTKDANNNTLVNVSATTTINSFFLSYLLGSKTLNVSSSAQATRNPLVMSLVLDESFSMTKNGGAQALPPAVNNFISHFDDGADQVAMVSFATLTSVDVPLAQPFTSKIQSAVNAMQFGNGPNGPRTNSYAGMVAGQNQIQSATVSGPNVQKVAVFFTDGWANTIKDNLKCSASSVLTPLLYCGCDPGDDNIMHLCSGVVFMNPNTGSLTNCTAETQSGATFPSQQTGKPQPLVPATPTGMDNCAAEACYRTVQVANSMRAQGVVVYSIGLGDAINQPFLQQVANDPASSTFDASKPIGQAVFSPTSAQLYAVFETIASKVLLRLSQ